MNWKKFFGSKKIFWSIWLFIHFLSAFRLKWIVSLLSPDVPDCNIGFCFIFYLPSLVAELYLVIFVIISLLSIIFQLVNKYALAYVMLAILLLPVLFDLYRSIILILGIK